MPAPLFTQVRHLALNPHIPNFNLEDVFHAPYEPADGHDPIIPALILMPPLLYPHARMVWQSFPNMEGKLPPRQGLPGQMSLNSLPNRLPGASIAAHRNQQNHG